MRSYRLLKAIIALCLGLIGSMESVKAQLVQLPINRTSNIEQKSNILHGRIKEDAISLPFWDDFHKGKLDTTLWLGQGAHASRSAAVNAPSLGAVIMDGSNEKGKPYSNSIREQGIGDQLTSRPIYLDSIPDEEKASIYLSFFWEAGGKAELPDETDRLELYFLDSLDQWNKVWEVSGGDLSRDQFSQEIIGLGSIYLHDHFQFRFQNAGRLSGPFDTWLIDYIYLNKNRSEQDTQYLDRALTQPSTHFLGIYGAMPLFEFNQDPNAHAKALTNQFYNLNNRFRAMEYSVEIRDKANKELIIQINDNTPFNPVPLANERRDFSSASPGPFPERAWTDPFDMESSIYLTTGDFFLIDSIAGEDTTYHTHIDFRINDTIRQTIPIRDYFAYDNGQVDYAAGINQRSGMLAVAYELSQPAYINALSINFTNSRQVGTAIDLMVWQDLDDTPLFTKEVTIQPKDSINGFIHYPLDTGIRVQDTFHVGFAQFTNDFVHVGLDISNDSGDKIFYNIAGIWEQNEEVSGSLMLRPHLSLAPPVSGGNGQEEGISAYPNPVIDQLYLEGNINEVKIFDSFGREINTSINSFEKGKIISFAKNHRGVYIVKALVNGQPQTIRILVK
ncbi:T9SS type A sorting domain-containing protein [Echinicola jeungdonensis]|uniref:T9SS type A sorting domain-containing protein n=1 Tax=Echinicola jeungdonensis TaxID=709343 RepID=A0ABV5J1W8_9BACT|nr:T9SS type A sorting domain-containing protein [Echinicola jeungdonensis]MDN3671096.1 T9SS type A sorting domain-containing protein [Echinicola jeungdonensis]